MKRFKVCVDFETLEKDVLAATEEGALENMSSELAEYGLTVFGMSIVEDETYFGDENTDVGFGSCVADLDDSELCEGGCDDCSGFDDE